MTIFTEKSLTNLFDGADDVDGDTVSLYRINGAIPPSWPHSVALPQGSVTVDQDGTISFDDGLTGGGAASGPPILVANGSFTFTLWDAQDESGVYTATISLEQGGFTSTAPAQPTLVVISGVTGASFDVVLPVDPDDGGDPIIKRVISVIPEADYNAGNFSNATYINDLSAQETRTIDAGNFSAIGSSQTHVVRWKAVNGSTDNSGHGAYSNPVTATLSVPSNPPVFTTQPSLGASGFTVGNTVTLSLGAGTGDNAVTASIEYFRLGTTSKVSELSGLNWNSAGEGAGTLYFRTRLTDDVTGTFVLSNEVTASLSASGGTGTVKDQVIALFGTSGRNSVAAIQTLNSGNAPAGVSVTSNAVNINQPGVTLENYIISGKSIYTKANNITIRQNRIFEGSLHSLGGIFNRLIDVNPGISGLTIDDNDFEGTKGVGAGISAPIFFREAAGTGNVVRRNRFKWFGQDVIKPAGGVLIEENVLYAPSNINIPPDTSGTNGRNTNGKYAAGGTYAFHEVVQAPNNLKHYISLVSNNNGNPLTDQNSWRYTDPHYDMINPYGNNSPSIIRRNLLLADPQHSMIPASDRTYAVGNVYEFSIQRNNSNPSAAFFDLLTVEDNVILGHNTYFSNPVFSAGNLNNNRIKPVIQGNYIDADSSGRYTIPGTDGNVAWGVNYDATTGVSISP